MATTNANILATRRAACNTGNRDTTPGALTVFHLEGMPYHVETANERHTREVCERLAALRPQPVVATPVQAPAAQPAAKRKRKAAAHLVASMATFSAPVAHPRKPRSVAAKARDARYQWLKRRLRKLGTLYVSRLAGGVGFVVGVIYSGTTVGHAGDRTTEGHRTVLDALEALWAKLG